MLEEAVLEKRRINKTLGRDKVRYPTGEEVEINKKEVRFYLMKREGITRVM